jgi:predicted membrane-bound spermidine synthase
MGTVSLRDWFDMIRAENWFNKLSAPRTTVTESDAMDWMRRTQEHLHEMGEIA